MRFGRSFPVRPIITRAPLTTVSPPTPISDSDSGSGSDVESLVALLSGADTNATTTEIFSLVASLSGADTNSTVTETATVTVPVSASDFNGIVSEIITQVAAYTSADATPTAAESSSLVARPTATDANSAVGEATKISLAGSDVNGSVTETAAPSLTVTGTDANGATTESASFVAQASATDTNGALTEAAALRITAGVDSGSDTEVGTPKASLTGTDANGVTGEAASNGSPVSAADTNSATTEAATPQATAAAVDSGTDTETQNYTYALSTSDDVAGRVNLISGSFNGTTNAWTASTSGSQVITSDLTIAHEGTGSLKCVTDGLFPGQGVSSPIVNIEAGQPYTAAVWLYSDLGGENMQVQVVERRADNSFILSTDSLFTMVAGWQRVIVTRYMTAGGVKANVKVSQNFNATFPITFHMDEAMLVTGVAAPASYVTPGAGVIENASPAYRPVVIDADGVIGESAATAIAQSSQDAGTASGEASTLQARPTAQDGSQSVTEAAIPAVRVAGSDFNGPTVEFGTYRYAIATQTDHGSGSDTQAAFIRITTADVGTAIESSVTVKISFLVTDAGIAIDSAVVDTHVVPGHMPGILLASMTLPELVRAEITTPVIVSADQEEFVTLLDATEGEPDLVAMKITKPIITKVR